MKITNYFTEKISYCLSGELTKILHENEFSKDGTMTWPLDFVFIDQIFLNSSLSSLENKNIQDIALEARTTKIKNLEKLLTLDYVDMITIDSSFEGVFEFELFLNFEDSKMNCSKLLKKYKLN